MKINFEDEMSGSGLLELEIYHSSQTADIHILDLGSSNLALMQAMSSDLQCRILAALGENAAPGQWKWFLYHADGIITWYDEGEFHSVRAVDEPLLVPRFVKQMESRCCQWYGEGRIK